MVCAIGTNEAQRRLRKSEIDKKKKISTSDLAESGGSTRSSNALRVKMVSPIGVGMCVMNIVASVWYCDGNLDIQTRLLFRSKVVMDTPFSFDCWLKVETEFGVSLPS